MIILLIMAFGLGYWLAKDSRPNAPIVRDDHSWLQRIINALVFTAQDEQGKTKSKATKEALQRVIDAGYKEQYGYVPDQATVPPASVYEPDQPAGSVAVASQPEYIQGPNLVQQTPVKQDLDNTSLLLYFGAFLFIASIGLFVAFSDLDGSLRTFLVGLVASAMYCFGFWLHSNKKKLEEVGLTFIGIGMSALPFVGLATYYYVYDEEFGPVIWVVTSIVTLVVYAFTLIRLRNTFISYMLIASIVSLFESAVSVIEAPSYYYVWMLIVVGIVLQFVSLTTKHLPELKDSSAQSSRVLVPLTLLSSFFIMGSDGTWQFAVSMLLAATYYAQQFFIVDKDKELYSMGSHSLLIGSIVVGAYSMNESMIDVSLSLLVITGIHSILMVAVNIKQGAIAQRFVDVALLTAGATVLVGLSDPLHLTIAFIVAMLLGAIVTVRTEREDSFTLTLIAWVIFSVVMGQVYPDVAISYFTQALLSLGFTLPLLALLHAKEIKLDHPNWLETVKVAIGSLHLISIFFAFLSGEYSVLSVSMVVTATCLMLVETLHERYWADLGVIYTLIPITYVLMVLGDDGLRAMPLFTWSVVATLLVNIFISMRHKLESARWVSAAGWLALPFALGVEEIGDFDLSANLQMWLYLAASIALSVSRAIARGRLLLSKKVSLASMEKGSSAAYETALAISTVVTVVLAFVSLGTVAESTLVIVLASVIMVAGGTIIEREPHYVALIPFLAQVALLRLLEPYDPSSWLVQHNNLVHVFVFLSSALATVTYLWITTVKQSDRNKVLIESIRDAAVTTAFIAPFSFVIFGEIVWAMPATLIVASLVSLHYQWGRGIGKREITGLVLLSGVFWLMYLNNISNVHIYTHMLAVTLGVYGYFRYLRKDEQTANNYWGYMFFIATLPLALNVIQNYENQELYSVWLLGESWLFFSLGYYLKAVFLRRLGMYAGLGSIFIVMYAFGVRNLQAYTHVLAAMLAVFGIMAERRKDQILANQYFGSMLAVATIPLALQTLEGTADSRLYGIWLLLENITFFLIGITVRNQLITKWGLYVSILVVLYELRDLGWAMLSVIALVLIGIGAYRALNQPDEPEDK